MLLDFAKREISVADAEQLGGNRGYEIVVRARERLGQLIITSARLDGVQVDGDRRHRRARQRRQPRAAQPAAPQPASSATAR